MIHTIYNWIEEDFTYLRICKCASSTLVNHLHTNNHHSIIGTEATGATRFAAIRHPVSRAISFYSRSYASESFERFVRVLLPELVKRNPHARPYAEIEHLATHIRSVEHMHHWWGQMYMLKPSIFGDYPRRNANRSKDVHRPSEREVHRFYDEIADYYDDDLALWTAVFNDDQ